jgi:hypothetical protein
MQKIEVPSTAQSADSAGASKLRKSQYARLNKRTIAAAALAAGLFAQTQGFAQVPNTTSAGTAANAEAMSDPEKAARETWRAVMRNTPLPGKGCFHVKYPNVAWDNVECKKAKPRPYPPSFNGKVGAPGAGNGNDYVAQAQGLISGAWGKFFISGVTSETGADPSDNSQTAPNEYSLQLNTNSINSITGEYIRTAACGDYSDCHVWQQFIYATDYNQQGEAALFIQYWLYNWTGLCPTGWWTIYDIVANGSPGTETCYKNSNLTPVPDIPVTNLGDVILSAQVENGGNDVVWLEYGDDSWAQINADSSAPCCEGGLDIASVWNQAEFNVLGNMNLTQANFNTGSQITVVLAILDGSNSAPACVPNAGTTGETNNLTLGTCQGGVGNVIDVGGCGNQNACVGGSIYGPYIDFSEYVPVLSTPCLSCGGGGGTPPPPPIKQ